MVYRTSIKNSISQRVIRTTQPSSVVVKDLRFEDKNKDLRLEDKDKDLGFGDKDKDLWFEDKVKD